MLTSTGIIHHTAKDDWVSQHRMDKIRVLAISLEGKLILAVKTELGHGGYQVQKREDWVQGLQTHLCTCFLHGLKLMIILRQMWKAYRAYLRSHVHSTLHVKVTKTEKITVLPKLWCTSLFTLYDFFYVFLTQAKCELFLHCYLLGLAQLVIFTVLSANCGTVAAPSRYK